MGLTRFSVWTQVTMTSHDIHGELAKGLIYIVLEGASSGEACRALWLGLQELTHTTHTPLTMPTQC